jgi:hypothetical protein
MSVFGRFMTWFSGVYMVLWLVVTCIFWVVANKYVGKDRSNIIGALYMGLVWPAVLVTLLYYVIRGIPETREERGTIPVK